MLKFRKISTRMLTFLLSVSLLSLILLSTVSYISSRAVIQNQINQNMNAELNAQVNNILLRTTEIKVMASQIARGVADTYPMTALKAYEQMLSKSIFDNELVYGSGIWFEPYVYDAREKYVGPYVYKDQNLPVVTYDYSNEQYDYFSYDWYKNAMSGLKSPQFSELYHDDTLNVTMASCTAPMFGNDGKVIGAVTVDMDITSIQNLMNGIKIGKEGRVTLLTSDGLYITNEDSAKVMKAKITEDNNKSLADIGQKILSSDGGTGKFTKNGTIYNTYYSKVGDLGWKIMIQIPRSEINQPLDALLMKLIIISVISLLLLLLVVYFEVRNLTRNVVKVHKFALRLAEGDFTTRELDIKSVDEIGQMGQALNHMLLQNKTVIQTISQESKNINMESQRLEDTTINLTDNVKKIEEAISDISENMMSSSASTEEVNASVEEVNASINILAHETGMSSEMANTIKARAADVQMRSSASYEKAMILTTDKEKRLQQSIEETKIVDSIGIMAATISQIAEQVNLLSLNASIEAARAGDQGKGFAVVATEIGKLANQATTTVNEITQTTEKVKSAFSNLVENSKQLLDFIQNIVTPDYKSFVTMGNQYEVDANSIKDTAAKISDMTRNIERIIKEVTEAIQGIAIEAENAASNSTNILDSMEKVSEEVDHIDKAVAREKMLSDNLDQMVNKFHLE